MKQLTRAAKRAPVVESDSDESEQDTSLQKSPNSHDKKEIVSHKAKTLSDDSSSESDIESYLQPINKIDLNSPFFNLQKKKDVDQSAGDQISRLNDSDESMSDVGNELSQAHISDTASTSTTNLNFQHLEDYKKKLEEAKKHVDEYNARKKLDENNLDILNLLAAGETKQITLENIKPEDLHSSDFEAGDSEREDWEEVNVKEAKEKRLVPENGVQITLDMPDTCRKKKGVDLLAAMKRRLNRIRKENQVYVHKVHLLGWIAHGNYVNACINDTQTLALAISLLPSDKCYPSDRTDLNYLEQIVQWYTKTVTLVEKAVPRRKLLKLLEQQIEAKVAWSKQILVYIFIAILRALGIQCRLVLSFQVEPLRPPASELHSLAKDKDAKVDEISKNKSVSSKAGSKVEPGVKRKSSLTEKGKGVASKRVNVDEKRPLKDTGKSSKERNVALKRGREGGNKVAQTQKKESSGRKVKEVTVSDSKSSTSKGGRTRTRSKKDVGKDKGTSRGNLPQVDGPDDGSDSTAASSSRSKKKSSPKKPNLKKLHIPLRNVCEVKKHPSRLTTSFEDNDSEAEFKPITKKNSESHKSKQTLKVNLQRLKQSPPPKNNSQRFNSPPKKQLDVKNDIINLIKGRITEQKHLDRSRKVKKRRPPSDSESDSDYMLEPVKKKQHDSDIEYFVPKPKVKPRVSVQRSPPDQQVVRSYNKKRKGTDVWAEVFLESEEKWISVDVVQGEIHCVNQLFSRANHPVSYIVAWNNNQSIKDVSKRYCTKFNTIARLLRVDNKWWEETLKPFRGKQSARDKEEDDDLNQQELDEPMPKTVSEYKNHPLYALRRHLLKFEEMYPSDIQPLGFIRGEPVYPRNCVYVCRSRDIWLKEARVVKPGEKPYKIVKARPKYDKLSNKVVSGQMLEIFGEWQTMEYEPPTAENGVVPKNAFGNVELFKPCMLPKGTVHLKLAGLQKICYKIGVDCASAITGFDFHCGWSHPVYDGHVVCEEHADIVVAAWELEQDEIEKREKEKVEKRVYANWKKLIKGLLIRERLKRRYDFGSASTSNAQVP